MSSLRPVMRPRSLVLLLVGACMGVGCWIPLQESAAGSARPRACTDARRREHATLRGLQWLSNYIPQHRAAIWADAYSVYFEVGRTASSPAVRALAVPLARREATVLYQRLMRPRGLSTAADVLAAAGLLPDAKLLGLKVQPLLGRVQSALTRFHSVRALYGVDPRRVSRLGENGLFTLLANTYTMVRASAAFPGRIRAPYGLAKYLIATLDRPLVTLAQDHSPHHVRFDNQAYWATHIAYALEDYGNLRLRPSDIGPVWTYMRSQFYPVLRWHGDFDLFAEFVDIFRGVGLGMNDPEVCVGTSFVLSHQHSDGSFSNSDRRSDPYNAIHATWVGVDAVRDRFFLSRTPYARRVRQIANAVARAKRSGALKTVPASNCWRGIGSERPCAHTPLTAASVEAAA